MLLECSTNEPACPVMHHVTSSEWQSHSYLAAPDGFTSLPSPEQLRQTLFYNGMHHLSAAATTQIHVSKQLPSGQGRTHNSKDDTGMMYNLHHRCLVPFLLCMQTAASCKAKGAPSCDTHGVDLSKSDEVRKFAQDVLDKYKNVDVLVNNAGMGPSSGSGPIKGE